MSPVVQADSTAIVLSTIEQLQQSQSLILQAFAFANGHQRFETA